MITFKKKVLENQTKKKKKKKNVLINLKIRSMSLGNFVQI